jgi:hypothetical protein
MRPTKGVRVGYLRKQDSSAQGAIGIQYILGLQAVDMAGCLPQASKCNTGKTVSSIAGLSLIGAQL